MLLSKESRHDTYGYSAPILGPVIRVRRGDEVEMVVENHLDAATTVHWHGLLVPGHNDGGPQQLIQPGKRWRPVLKIDQPAATLWFHPYPHGDTARQIYMTGRTRCLSKIKLNSSSPLRARPFMFHCHILEHEEAGLMGQYVCT